MAQMKKFKLVLALKKLFPFLRETIHISPLQEGIPGACVLPRHTNMPPLEKLRESENYKGCHVQLFEMEACKVE